MMKRLSRVLAMVLVLCMVVAWVPVRAHAEELTEEELLRRRQVAEAAAAAAAAAAAQNKETPAPAQETSNNNVTPPPAADAGNTVVPPAADAGNTDVPPAADVNDAVVPPAEDVNDTVVPPAEDVNDTDVPPAEDVNDTDVPPAEDVDDADVPPAEDVDDTDVPPAEDVEDTDVPPAEDVEDTDVPPAEDVEDTDVPPTEDVEDTDVPPTEDEDDTEETTPEETVAEVSAVVQKAAPSVDHGTPSPRTSTSQKVKVEIDENTTRIEHEYEDENGQKKYEYFYNEENKTGSESTTKKYFTVVKEVVNNVTKYFANLWSNFFGSASKLQTTSDAFEGAAAAGSGKKETYDNLEAAADANEGKTVEMLGNYTTNTGAAIEENVTIEMNGHSYTNTSGDAAIAVVGKTVTIRNGDVISAGVGLQVQKSVNAGGNLTVEDVFVDAENIGVAAINADNLTLKNSSIVGTTGVYVEKSNATIQGSYVAGKDGSAVQAVLNTGKKVQIKSGLFESKKNVKTISTDSTGTASVQLTGGAYSNSEGLYQYTDETTYAVINRNNGSDAPFEVVTHDYKPSVPGYRFLGYVDAKGKAITLKDAAKNGVVAKAVWEKIPEETKTVTVNDLISIQTAKKGCTAKITVKADTAVITVKDAKGNLAAIDTVNIRSIKQLQNLKIDTIEIQVDEDVKLVLDIAEAKKNGFEDSVKVELEEDILTISSGKNTCIELNIAELKAADKPVEIQLVEGELTVLLGKSSSLTVDLTKAMKTEKRIVVKLQTGVLKLFDKYNKPIK